MSKSDGVVVILPSAEEYIHQIERLVQIQELAGPNVEPLYSQRIDVGIFRAECVIPGLGRLSIMKSIYGSDYSIIDCIFCDDASYDEGESIEARYVTVSRLSQGSPWILHETSSNISSSDMERLTAFVSESPQEVFERLFDLWFYDYPGVVPDDFTVDKIESIYNEDPRPTNQ